jgi:hypothetical protein
MQGRLTIADLDVNWMIAGHMDGFQGLPFSNARPSDFPTDQGVGTSGRA